MIYFFLIIFILFSLSASPVFAVPFEIRSQYFLEHPFASGAFEDNLGAVISLILPNLMMIAGVYFLFLIIYGGYLLIVYGGKMNSPGVVEKGKNSITYGVIGLLLVIAGYFILSIISTVTGINLANANVN